MLAQHARTEADILPQHLQHGQPPAFSNHFLRLLDAAQLHECLPPRFCGAHTRTQVVLNVHLEMALHLRGELALPPFSTKEFAQPQQPSTQPFHKAPCHSRLESLPSYSRARNIIRSAAPPSDPPLSPGAREAR